MEGRRVGGRVLATWHMNVSWAKHPLWTPRWIMITRRIARAETKIPSFVSTEATDLIKKVRRVEASSLNPLSGNLLTSTIRYIVTGYQSKQRVVA